MTGETTHGGRAAARADLETLSRVYARRAAADSQHRAAQGGSSLTPARDALDSVLALQRAVHSGSVEVTREQLADLEGAARTIAEIALDEGLRMT